MFSSRRDGIGAGGGLVVPWCAACHGATAGSTGGRVVSIAVITDFIRNPSTRRLALEGGCGAVGLSGAPLLSLATSPQCERAGAAAGSRSRCAGPRTGTRAP